MGLDLTEQILTQWAEERPDLEIDALGIALRLMSLNRQFALEATRALAPLDLELWEYDVLSALRRQGRPFRLAATVLAQETELSPGAMTHRLKKLEARGLIRRRQDRADRRGVNVALTARGRRLTDRAIDVRLASARAAMAGMSSANRRQLLNLLQTLAQRVDQNVARG